ncbi:serine/threonine-protein kinase [Amycolatopsis sp. PS_44_ISF1]|uniref:serine/threonine-protein kinase n=1 Tax=Amycolatopsis sp. PS_44_ISF1 TaxID=2974917 RepID=UPI0028DD6C0E|nr:serine/threonine-protein kinase [Amycolatopsis sp. PS_44_ISF1]MDT8915912.1 serine/threonine protein kinase [Amycolatopsis sp. PS_44_ISF1]
MTEESRQVAGRYQLVELIGSGAMGMVWRGEDKILGRVVAVKELLMPVNQGEEKVAEAKSRAMREARIAARLQHPNAISVFNVVEHEDRPWLIMEYLPSRSLSAKLHEDGPMTVDEVIPVAVQLAGVLAAAHRAGIVHRDVKPGNILLGEDGTVKVTDFGISRAVGDVTLTATGEISGTPAFLAPEAARGEEATFPSDVFALGATLYMAVEGAPPFGTADNAIALLYRVSSGEIIPPERAGRLEPLLLKLLELKPEDRPSMTEVLAELRELDGGVTPVATVPEPLTLPRTKPVALAASASAAAAADSEAAGSKAGSEAADSEAVGSGAAGSSAASAPPGSPGVDRRRRPMILAGIGALLVVLAVVAIVLVNRNTSGNTAGPSPSSSQPPASSPAPSPSESPATPTIPTTPPSSSSAPPTSSSAPPSSSANPSQTTVQALQNYFGLLPGNTDTGFTLLSKNFLAKRGQTLDSYKRYWRQFSGVSVSNVQQTGSDTLNADVTYIRPGGGKETDPHHYRMVQEDGVWKIDSES